MFLVPLIQSLAKGARELVRTKGPGGGWSLCHERLMPPSGALAPSRSTGGLSVRQGRAAPQAALPPERPHQRCQKLPRSLGGRVVRAGMGALRSEGS